MLITLPMLAFALSTGDPTLIGWAVAANVFHILQI